ncbi:hypothetical protein [Streptomyces sp. PU-14G]|uniref:hypothetical protein n=1 Tax=Streptomyces sp. PU-14G TaxID=2800808 RepID=UPI0034DFF48D
MRWLTLYARSRQVPASVAVIVLSALTVGFLAPGGGAGPGDLRLPALALAAGATAASAGLGGQDPALDRTAALRWVYRRAVHVLLIGAVAGAALLSAQALGEHMAPVAFLARDSAGLAGLVAAATAVWGARNAWILPTGWLAFALFAPAATSVPLQVGTWMLLPPGTTAATWTAVALALVGTAAYAVAGPRR